MRKTRRKTRRAQLETHTELLGVAGYTFLPDFLVSKYSSLAFSGDVITETHSRLRLYLQGLCASSLLERAPIGGYRQVIINHIPSSASYTSTFPLTCRHRCCRACAQSLLLGYRDDGPGRVAISVCELHCPVKHRLLLPIQALSAICRATSNQSRGLFLNSAVVPSRADLETPVVVTRAFSHCSQLQACEHNPSQRPQRLRLARFSFFSYTAAVSAVSAVS
ncbi:hypothetical protein F4821DRAFT_51097 [Hypoxylon rubiginosum]|uniref:Uncharacterized protein n=1 Tax=Hypoxylon rubiginosum TaxID=110542 RepID=A0ACC0DAT9_9PEZI|nr:hypothetical protein F4821DRAFT_51097 [Hypoxylon rubiginosum]